MTIPAIVTLSIDGRYVSLAGISLKSILSAELFLESAGTRSGVEVSDLCHKKWFDLANTLTALPELQPSSCLCLDVATNVR